MRGYSATSVFATHEVALYRQAVQIVDCLPDELDLRCHEVARVVDRLLPPPPAAPGPSGPPATFWYRRHVIDGRYGSVEHSWIELFSLQPARLSILDVYAVGRLPVVQLVEVSPHYREILRHDGYREGPKVAVQQDVVDRLVHQLIEQGFELETS